MDPAACALGREIPERAVERIARRARGHCGLQALAIETPFAMGPAIASIAAATPSTVSP